MKPPLHKLVLAYKMECDRLMNSNNTAMGKLCTIFSVSLGYVELMKFNSEIHTNDIEVWGALFNRYMKAL
jgi:ribosomal protein L27